MKQIKKLPYLILLPLMLASCRPEQASTEYYAREVGEIDEDANIIDIGEENSHMQESQFTKSFSPPENTVCGGINGDDTQDENNGLIGGLRLFKNINEIPGNLTQSDYNNLRKNLDNYHDDTYSFPVENLNIYMSQVAVPNTPFSEGFLTQSGDTLEHNGETLNEFFNLNLETRILVSDEEQAGEYEFAIASDDGARMIIKPDDSEEYAYVNYPTNTPERLHCHVGDQPSYLTLGPDSPLDIELNYFQGPRLHIAFTVFWRKMPEETSDQVHSQFCGLKSGSGEDRFTRDQLFNEGWSIVPRNVFVLPHDAPLNPCTDEQSDQMMISHLSFSESLVSEGVNPEVMVQEVKVYIQENGSGQLTQYVGDFDISYSMNQGMVDYLITLDEPILNNVQKTITVKYMKMKNHVKEID